MALFTKRHYNAVAADIKARATQAYITGDDYAELDLSKVTFAIADFFGRDNPAFDRDRFIRACSPRTKAN